MTLIKPFIALTMFLYGCSGVKTPAGPICVSCKPYCVRGSWHYPQTYYEYDETGLASWYGDDFHGKAKATGEKFNKLAMTAAHKTLPIPSVVKVTNLRSGKSVVVVVDDRGPFCYKGRIIDLSYSAAKVLDLHRYKPSPVRVQTLVSDSLKLSYYISQHCKRRKDPFGRSWSQLYFQEIAGVKLPVYKGNIEKTVVRPKHVAVNLSRRKYNSLGSYLNSRNI
jgi:rare lipoprotein A (peptidoglycan hydrolase)